MGRISKMGILIKIIKYGLVLATGYYLGSGCDYKPLMKYNNYSKLEQEVIKNEKKISKNQETRAKFFS